MLKKNLRLRKRSSFKKIFFEGAGYPGKYVVIYILNGHERYGFIASRKAGNAVQRNRAKRLMREVVRLNISEMLPGKQMVFIARSSSKGKSYSEIERSILNTLFRIKKTIQDKKK